MNKLSTKDSLCTGEDEFPKAAISGTYLVQWTVRWPTSKVLNVDMKNTN